MKKYTIAEVVAKVTQGITDILGQDGLILKRIPNTKYNHKQVEYANAILSGLSGFDPKLGRAGILMCEGGTGLGKAMGFSVAYALWSTYTGDRMCISTFTKHLQMQLMDKDLPNAIAMVAEYTNTPKRVFSFRIGVGNFLSTQACMLHRTRLIAKDATLYAEAIDFLTLAVQWLENVAGVKEPSSGILMDFMELLSLDSLPNGISLKDIQLTLKSATSEKHRYLGHVLASKTSDIFVTNHTMIASHAYYNKSILDMKGFEFKHLLIDEADQFPSAAELVIGGDLYLSTLLKNCKDAEINKEAIAVVADFYHYVSEGMDDVIPPSNIKVVGVDNKFSKLIADTHASLKPCAAKALLETKKASLNEEELVNKLEFLDSFQELDKTYKAYLDSKNKVAISWSPVKKNPTIRITTSTSGAVIGRLFNHTKAESEAQTTDDFGNAVIKTYLNSITFTSATISDPSVSDIVETFDHFSSLVGVIRFPKKGSDTPIHNALTKLYRSIEPDKDFGKMSFVFADVRVPNPTKEILTEDGIEYITDPEYLKYLNTVIDKARANGGDTLTLTTSWDDNGAVAEMYKGAENSFIHAKGEPLRAVVRSYLAAPNSLMVTPGGWSGTDMPGRVKNVVVARIPYAPVDRQKEEITKATWEEQGRDLKKFDAIKWKAMNYQAIVKLAQGIGRGIRSSTDEVTIWIADPRFPRPDHFINSANPELLEAGANRSSKNDKFRKAIPKRFRESAYKHAKVLTIDGKLLG